MRQKQILRDPCGTSLYKIRSRAGRPRHQHGRRNKREQRRQRLHKHRAPRHHAQRNRGPRDKPRKIAPDAHRKPGTRPRAIQGLRDNPVGGRKMDQFIGARGTIVVNNHCTDDNRDGGTGVQKKTGRIADMRDDGSLLFECDDGTVETVYSADLEI